MIELKDVRDLATPVAPNTALVYLRDCGPTARRLCRIVLRGAYTEEHDERIRRALGRRRLFLGDIVDGGGGVCELIALTPTLAGSGDGRCIEEMVAQFEAAAMTGWQPASAALNPALASSSRHAD